MNRIFRIIGVIAIGVVVVACGKTRPPADESGVPPTLKRPFVSIESAVAAGIVAPEVAAVLAQGKRVNALAILDVGSPAFTLKPDKRPESQYAELLRDYKAVLSEAKNRLHARNPGIERIRDYDALPVEYIQLANREQLLKLANDGLLRAVAADVVNELYLGQSLPLIGAISTTSWGERGAGVEVAILDTGANLSQTVFGSCPGAGVPGCKISVAQDFGPDDGAQDASASQHGSRLASIVLAVAPESRVLALDVTTPGTEGSVPDSNALAALNFVINQRPLRNIRAVNISWGHREYWTQECASLGFWRNPYVQPVALLRSMGVVIVAATGNDAVDGGFHNGVAYPACTPGVVRVGAVYDANIGAASFTGARCSDATTSADQVVCMSQSGPLLTLLAPGGEITTLGIPGTGTSLAAPHVAGSVAVLAGFQPTLTSEAVVTALTSVGPVVTDPRNGIARPRLDTRAALKTRALFANDNLANARPLTGGSVRVEGVNWDATGEPGEPAHAGNAGGASVWYRWQPGYTGQARIATTGSGFDTLLAVYTGSAATSLTPVAANDDAAGTTTSEVTFNVSAGTNYLIAVDGKKVGNNPPRQGRLLLSINLQAPANDLFVNAQAITAGAMVTGSNRGAAREPGEPQHCGNDGGASVWYAWRAPATGRFQARTTSGNFGNRCVRVYTLAAGATGVAGLQYVAGGQWATPDDIWNAAFDAVAGTTYFVVVEGMSPEEPGYGPARGEFTLVVGP